MSRNFITHGSFIKLCLQLIIAVVILASLLPRGEASNTPTKLFNLCDQFNTLNTAIRDRTIQKSEAKDQFRTLIAAIRNEYYTSGAKDYPVTEWVFPLKGYGYKAIGVNGYHKAAYDYFDGNKHKGHPSLDIFIHDKKQNSLDDLTNKPVSVLSLTGGVVVAVENSWETSSSLRGGEYIWIYDPIANSLIYYAHNSKVLVQIGDLVKPGDTIAEVGRTGLNAHKRRSPSHLHLTYLSIVNELPVPKNIYKGLLRSKLL